MGETHDVEGHIPEKRGPAELDMDVDVMEHKSDDHTDLDEQMAVLTKDARQEIADANVEIMDVIRALGGSGHKCVRERARGIRAAVSEIYSPPRVTTATKLLPEQRINQGFALDPTTADSDGAMWDFGFKVMRERAMKKPKDERPMLLVGSPMCTAFSI